MDPETRALLLQKLPADIVGEIENQLENAYRAEHKEKMDLPFAEIEARMFYFRRLISGAKTMDELCQILYS